MNTVKTGRALLKALELGRLMTESDMTIVLQKLTMSAFQELEIRSARDLGFLRSNWDVVVDASPPNEKLTNRARKTFSDATMPSVRIRHNSIIVLFNNTEYAIYLEQGTPNMREQPMVEPTHQMLVEMARALTEQLSKKVYDV